MYGSQKFILKKSLLIQFLYKYVIECFSLLKQHALTIKAIYRHTEIDVHLSYESFEEVFCYKLFYQRLRYDLQHFTENVYNKTWKLN